jgi:hypothetical protein
VLSVGRRVASLEIDEGLRVGMEPSAPKKASEVELTHRPGFYRANPPRQEGRSRDFTPRASLVSI